MKPKEVEDSPPLYQKEKDPITQIIKRILYSEGDHIFQSPDAIYYLRK